MKAAAATRPLRAARTMLATASAILAVLAVAGMCGCSVVGATVAVGSAAVSAAATAGSAAVSVASTAVSTTYDVGKAGVRPFRAAVATRPLSCATAARPVAEPAQQIGLQVGHGLRPTAMRIRPSPMPAAALASGLTRACVVV